MKRKSNSDNQKEGVFVILIYTERPVGLSLVSFWLSQYDKVTHTSSSTGMENQASKYKLLVLFYLFITSCHRAHCFLWNFGGNESMEPTQSEPRYPNVICKAKSDQPNSDI